MATGADGVLGRRAELAQIVRNAVSAYGVRVLMALSVVLLTPFLYRRLGAGGFGTWSVVYTISTVFLLVETGFSRGVSKLTAELLAARDRERLSSTIGASVGIFACLGVVALVISVVLGVFAPGLASASARHAFELGMFVVGIERLVYAPLGAYSAALPGYQRYDLHNIGNAVNVFVFTAGTIAVVEAGGGVFAVVVVFAVAHLLMGIIGAVFLKLTDPAVPLRPRFGDTATLRGLTRFSSYVLLAESMTFIGQRMDTLVIAAIRNAAAAGTYSAVLKLQTGLQSLTLPVLYQLMPMASDLAARGRRHEVLRRLRLATRVTLQVTLPVAAALALFASDIVHLWLGQDAPDVAEGILVVLMIVQVILLTAAAAEQVLVGIGRVRAIGLLAFLEGTSNVSISVALVWRYGAVGAAIGTLVTSGVLAPVKIPIVCRALGSSTGAFVRGSVVPAVASSAPALAAMALVRVFVSEGPARLVLGASVGMLLALVVAGRQLGPRRVVTMLRQVAAGRRETAAAAGSWEA